MSEKFKILILGNGRIGQAVLHYLKKNIATRSVAFLSDENAVKDCDLLIGALPGELGEKCLDLALRYKKNLIDISDIDPPFYLKAKNKIKDRGITVIPGCGFSPGLVNCILGREFLSNDAIRNVEIKSGSLSPRKFHYPFLWCFEDLILEHRIPSWQVIAGRRTKFPAFAGYQKEKFFGIEAESYLVASGFENLLGAFGVKDFKCRVIRPHGFMHFFNFLENQGFLEEENLAIAKKVLEQKKEDNMTLSEITLIAGQKRIVWQIKASSGKSEALNSMQKITAVVPAVIAKLLLENKIKERGLLFMEDLGRSRHFFETLLAEIKKEGIILKRGISKQGKHD